MTQVRLTLYLVVGLDPYPVVDPYCQSLAFRV
jgi:hypothetical protein